MVRTDAHIERHGVILGVIQSTTYITPFLKLATTVGLMSVVTFLII